MDASVRGLPLLSGPPPSREEPNHTTCRRCSKDLGFIFRTPRDCKFCGYIYCSSCCDHQALMPRQSNESGYDVVNVCSYCIEYLTLTASARSQLRLVPIAKLRAYLKAFNIPTTGALEKEDIVQAVVDARQPNGCLSPESEDYYRRSAVPDQRRGRSDKRNFLDRAANAARHAYEGVASGASGSGSQPNASGPTPSQSATRSRAPSQQQQQPSRPTSQPPPQSRPQYVPPPQQTRHSPASPQSQARSHPSAGYSPYQQRPPPAAARPAVNRPGPNASTRTSPIPSSRPPPPQQPIPPLGDLLGKTPEELSALSVHVLKEILHQNHVNARLILEKSDLVDRVRILIENERREQERQKLQERMEEEEAMMRQQMMMAEMRAREDSAAAARATPPAAADPETVPLPDSVVPSPGLQAQDAVHRQASPVPALSTSPSGGGMFASLERQGLCVVCQDSEANVALVDCGHLALCKSCSDLIWSTTRECPLCRTRIVTQERMLRIFKS